MVIYGDVPQLIEGVVVQVEVVVGGEEEKRRSREEKEK